MNERQVLAWRPSFPALKDILGTTKADILIDLLSDYAYKSSNNWNGNDFFSIQPDMYFKRTFSAILEYVSITPENLSKNIKALKELGLLKVKEKENIGDIYEYKVELFSEPYIVLAKQKLETVKDKYTRKRIQDFIDIVSQHELILDALIYPTKKVTNTDKLQETTSQESNPPEEKDLNTIVKYFKCWYKSIYNKDYNPNEIEIKRLQKIIKQYSIEQWGEMISIFIERYSEQWKSSEYPEPTIFGLTQDWIIKQVYSMYEQEVKYLEEERQRESLSKCSNGNSITWDDL